MESKTLEKKKNTARRCISFLAATIRSDINLRFGRKSEYIVREKKTFIVVVARERLISIYRGTFRCLFFLALRASSLFLCLVINCSNHPQCQRHVTLIFCLLVTFVSILRRQSQSSHGKSVRHSSHGALWMWNTIRQRSIF